MELEKRFQQIFDSLTKNDPHSALSLICPLIDRAGKEIYGIKKNGERFKKVIEENQPLIYWIMSSGKLNLGIYSDILVTHKGVSYPLSHFIYKMVRNSLLHDAEISKDFQFNEEGEISSINNVVSFPKSLVWALALTVISLPCYTKYCPKGFYLYLNNVRIPLVDIWGSEIKIRNFVSTYIIKGNS